MYPLLEILEEPKSSFLSLWTEIAEHAFLQLKHMISQAPTLIHPSISKSFQLFTSEVGVGGVLTQLDDSYSVAKHRPVGLFNRKFNKHQMHYDTAERKTLGAVCSVEQFRPFIFGCLVDVYYEQFSVQGILRQDKPGIVIYLDWPLTTWNYII